MTPGNYVGFSQLYREVTSKEKHQPHLLVIVLCWCYVLAHMTIMDKKPTLSSGMDPFLETDKFLGIVFFTEAY